MNPEFLTLDDLLEFHRLQLERFGGLEGLRDPSMLESALSQPEAVFDGDYLHPDLYAMAAAYLYHIVNNHPFVDGNKRVGLMAALVFLDINGLPIDHSSEELCELTFSVAAGGVDKKNLTARIQEIAER